MFLHHFLLWFEDPCSQERETKRKAGAATRHLIQMRNFFTTGAIQITELLIYLSKTCCDESQDSVKNLLDNLKQIGLKSKSAGF